MTTFQTYTDNRQENKESFGFTSGSGADEPMGTTRKAHTQEKRRILQRFKDIECIFGIVNEA